MPPKKEGGKLPDETIKDLEKWIAMGAPDPREGVPGAAVKIAEKKSDYGKAREWWAWQSPVKSAAPAVKDAAWPHNDIDRFLLAAMEEKGVKPVADADKLTLIRRVYFDLIGLPPDALGDPGFHGRQSAGRLRQDRGAPARVRRALASAGAGIGSMSRVSRNPRARM